MESKSSKKSKVYTKDSIFNDPNNNKIIDNLYIGTWLEASDPSFIKKNNINVILNLTTDIPNKFRKKLTYARVSVDDSLEKKDFDIMTKHFPFIVEFIHKHRDLDNKNVLVHCYEGIQRSAVAVLAYLLKYHPNLAPNIRTGKKFIESKRPIVFHNGENINFYSSLYKYYSKYIKDTKSTKHSKK